MEFHELGETGVVLEEREITTTKLYLNTSQGNVLVMDLFIFVKTDISESGSLQVVTVWAKRRFLN